MHAYVTPAAGRAFAELEIKRSRFLAYASHVESETEARSLIADVRREQHAARHHCSAFVLGPAATIARSSDDGEPSGTAGMPMLEVLRGLADPPLSDVAVVVARYFGGIKLGTGGLARAYAGAVAEVLGTMSFVVRRSVPSYTVSLPLPDLARLESALRHHCHVHDVVYTFPDATIRVASEQPQAELAGQISTLAGYTITCSPVEPVWVEQPYS